MDEVEVLDVAMCLIGCLCWFSCVLKMLRMKWGIQKCLVQPETFAPPPPPTG